ncbi:SufE family protein [Rheinheimera sp. MMS21-TC3]|uniref:SufE family protein n=1 Tax=Rheinheimera sp. MMS21-TC3 TaxID=3072790 RepID=UPI0028C4597E|nr:SufE family protein [Rheinheimera sp. MMS21-TC3]WNO61192.1 SufE family protein [Rheinheimera sp. MMS21-TC3]
MKLEQLLAETQAGLDEIKKLDFPVISQTKDWQSRYRVLMQLGKKLPALPEKMKQTDLLVKGCESRAWLLHYHDPANDKHFFILDSEARIVKGLMAIMLCQINGMSTAELASFDLTQLFDELNIKPYLSQSRGNGLTAMIQHIKSCIK